MTLFRFGDFRFDSRTGELKRTDETVYLRPQSAELLHHFLENSRRLVTKEELIERIWAGAHIQDQVVFQCVNDLRKALGETARAPRFIRTIPRKGYQWIYRDLVADSSIQMGVPRFQKRRWKRWILGKWIVLAVGILGFGTWAWWSLSRPNLIEVRCAPIQLNGAWDRVALDGDQDLNDRLRRRLNGIEGVVAWDGMDGVISQVAAVSPSPGAWFADGSPRGWAFIPRIQVNPDQSMEVHLSCLTPEGQRVEREFTCYRMDDALSGLELEIRLQLASEASAFDEAFANDKVFGPDYEKGVTCLDQGDAKRARFYFQRCLDRAPQWGWLQARLAQAGLALGAHDEARNHLARAREWAVAHGEAGLSAWLKVVSAQWSLESGKYETAEALIVEAMSELDPQRQPLAYHDARLLWGDVLIELGAWERAESVFQLHLYALADSGATTRLAHALNQLGWIALTRAESARARGLSSHAQALMRSSGDFRGLAETHENLAWVAFDQGRVADVEPHLALAREAAEAALDRRRVASLDESESFFAFARRDFGLAMERSRSAQTRFQEVGYAAGVARQYLQQAVVASESGDHETELAAIREAWHLLEGLEDPMSARECAVLRAWAEIRWGDLDASSVCISRASELGVEPFELFLLQARLAYEQGNFHDAVRSQVAARELGSMFWDTTQDQILSCYQQSAKHGTRVPLPQP